MNRKLKKICTMALTLAITASSAMSMSVSAVKISSLYDDYNIADDKGMMNYPNEGYKTIYNNQFDELLKVESNFRISQFFLSEDVNYEEVNERVIEIFEEFYPDNYLDVSEVPTEGMPPTNETYHEYLEYVENYRKNYKPNLKSNTEDGVTTYTVSVAYQKVSDINDERVEEARKCSKDFMKKLNDEKLISAFYDFGEVYSASGPYDIYLSYFLDTDINLIQNYIDEHNIDCSIKTGKTFYDLEFNDNTSDLEKFLIAADIYEETSIKVSVWSIKYLAVVTGSLYGKNALAEITTIDTPTPAINITGDANEDETIDIRDAAFIARKVAQRKVEELPERADYNNDNKLDILDAAAIAKDVARRILN